MLGDQLFRPTVRDVVTLDAAPTRLNFLGASSVAATLVAINSPIVPTDEVWVLSGLMCVMTPGAAQTAVPTNVSIVDTLLGIIFRIAEVTQVELGSTVALQTGFDRQYGAGVVVMPGESIRCICGFSAAGAANAVEFSFFGLKVPRGNLLK